jgi:hypothetical protein
MEEMWIDPPANLTDALKERRNSVALVQSLLQAAAQGVATSREENGYWTFAVHPDTKGLAKGLKLAPDRSLSGPSRDQLDLIYQVVRGIETELTEATWLPPQMRRARIARFCERLGISADLFSSVSRNWEKPDISIGA